MEGEAVEKIVTRLVSKPVCRIENQRLRLRSPVLTEEGCNNNPLIYAICDAQKEVVVFRFM